MAVGHIVLAIDRKYVAQAATLLVSLSAATSEIVPTTLLHCDLSAPDVQALQRVSAALNWPLDMRRVALPSGLPVTDWVSPATYLRLFAPASCADSSHLLYLDVDMLVLEDMTPLLTTIPQAPVAAVRDHFHRTFETGQALPGYRTGAFSRTPYFNAGVLVIDVDRWHRQDVTERALRFIHDKPQHIRFWDQDALNFVLEGQWEPLAPEWNCFPFRDLLDQYDWREPMPENEPLEELFNLEDRARVLHFAGPKKPWHEGYRPTTSRRLYRSMAGVAARLTAGSA